MELVSLLADDVTKEKNRLRIELLEFKRNGRDIPLSSITLTPTEKRNCFNNALAAKTWNLPEETRSEYRREIVKLLNAQKEDRRRIKEGILAGTHQKKPNPLPPLEKTIVIEDTSTAVQMELFAYNTTPPPWFRPYMDQS